MAELVDDEVVGDLLQRPADEDEGPELVAPEPAKAGNAEQPRRVQDAHAAQVDGPRVEGEAVQVRLGTDDRGPLGGAMGGCGGPRRRR